MSCIRFNTPAQRKQLRAMAPTMLTAEQAAALHPAPTITDSKIARLRLMARHSNPKIRESVASSRHTPSDLFRTLAADDDDGVRACVARNESTPRAVLGYLVDDSIERVRGFLAFNPSTSAETMARLAVDPSETVRGLVQWKTDVAAI